MPSSRGGKYGYVARTRFAAYRALRRRGMSKREAAAISNKGVSKAGRSSMARKGKRTRRAKGKR